MSFKYWIEEAEITTKLTKMGIGCTIANPFEICAKESEINDKRQSQFINKAKQSTLGLSESIGINGLNLKQSEGKENKLELSQD